MYIFLVIRFPDSLCLITILLFPHTFPSFVTGVRAISRANVWMPSLMIYHDFHALYFFSWAFFSSLIGSHQSRMQLRVN